MSKPPGDPSEALQLLLDASDLTREVLLRTAGGKIYLGRRELPGPFSEGEVDESLRLDPLPGGTYGLSVKRHTGRWEKTPFSGSQEELVEVIRTQMQHLIAPW